MNKNIIFFRVFVLIIILIIVGLIFNGKLNKGAGFYGHMEITSDAFKNNSAMPEKFTTDGENINPELQIRNIPPGAKSLVLFMEDPDAQKVVGYTWIHWVVFNIPVKGASVIVKENSIPGTSGESTYKKPEYGGPNPPAGSGVHHYYFKGYALDSNLDLEEGSTKQEIEESMKGHVLEQAELVGLYGR